MFGKLPPKLRAKLDAKAMRKFEAAQAGERPKGLSGIFSRSRMMPPKMMAEMAERARANMGNRPMGNRPMVEDIMVAEEGPVGMGALDMGTKPKMQNIQAFKKGGKVKKMAKGGSTASKRADGCATKGKTKGRFV